MTAPGLPRSTGSGSRRARPVPVSVGEVRYAGDVPDAPAVDAVAPDAVSRVERRDGLPLLLGAAHPEPGPLADDRRGARGTRGDAPRMAVALLEPREGRVRRADGEGTATKEARKAAVATQVTRQNRDWRPDLMEPPSVDFHEDDCSIAADTRLMASRSS